MLYKNLFLLWNNKYFLILPFGCYFYSVLHFLANCAFTTRGVGGEEGGGEGSSSHYILFPAESKDPLCLVCRQLLLRGEFLFRIPVCLRVQALTVIPRRAGWGLQGITKDAKDAASPTCSTEHIRSQGQAPTSFGSPPSSFSG